MKPILFNTEMVKAILDGIKTQTRRVIKLNIKKDNETHSLNGAVFTIDNKLYFEHNLIKNFSKYKVGDILYVREPTQITGFTDCDALFEIVYQFLSDGKIDSLTKEDLININRYNLSSYEFESRYLSKKYMEKLQKIPNGCLKEMARIFLKVTNVRVERLQDISVRNIEKETGWRREIYSYSNKNKAFLRDYCDFWNSTTKNGYKWEDNPYVFVYELERIENNKI